MNIIVIVLDCPRDELHNHLGVAVNYIEHISMCVNTGILISAINNYDDSRCSFKLPTISPVGSFQVVVIPCLAQGVEQ